MTTESTPARIAWGSALIVGGGLLMAGLWLVFTMVHGPTSFNEDRAILGGSMLFWGMLLGGIPNLLIAAGLVIVSSPLALAAQRMPRVGFVLLLIGLVVPAVIDLAIQALGAPFFIPFAAAGLIVLSLGSRGNPRVSQPSRLLLLVLGILLTIAFALALVPTPISDSVGGYRIYGAIAHLAVGLGWALFGISIGIAGRARSKG